MEIGVGIAAASSIAAVATGVTVLVIDRFYGHPWRRIYDVNKKQQQGHASGAAKSHSGQRSPQPATRETRPAPMLPPKPALPPAPGSRASPMHVGRGSVPPPPGQRVMGGGMGAPSPHTGRMVHVGAGENQGSTFMSNYI